jgi:RNA polymerase sigma-70 factor (ECF subfamily)
MGKALRERESCSDIAQSVCREALRDLPTFEYRGAASFRSWLYTTALNKIRQRGRFYLAEMRTPEREVSEGELASLADRYASICTPSQDAVARETAESIEAAFDELPEAHREVIALARVAGLTTAEIAQEMGRTEKAVRNLLSRALVRLSMVLHREGLPPGPPA